MMEEDSNELVIELLQNCGCLEYTKYFQKIPKTTFREFTEADLKERLPNTPEGEAVAIKIHAELVRFSSLQCLGNGGCIPNVPPGPVAKETNGSNAMNTDVKEEDDSSRSSSDSSDNTSAVPVSRSQPKTVVEVCLDSDSENSEQEGTSSVERTPATTQEEDTPSTSRYYLRQRKSLNRDYDEEDSDEAESALTRSKRRRGGKDETREENEIILLRNPLTLLKKLRRQPDFVDQCSHIAVCPENDFDDSHNCAFDDPLEVHVKHWNDFYKKFGPSIYYLELRIWSWKTSRVKCPFNLMKILSSFCLNLVELSIKMSPCEGALDDIPFPRELNLTHLKKIVISHPGSILYKVQLNHILTAAVNLETFDYKFHDHNDANELLSMLKSLRSIKFLSIRSYAKDGYLTFDQIDRLRELYLSNLEELELGNGLWEDVGGTVLEELLKKSQRLKRLKIYGNYQGDSLHKPDITVNLPPLANLESIDIGGNYEFASIDESAGSIQSSNEIVTVDDDLKTELFSATLKFPLLPNLQNLVLGNLFKIDELHFSIFPKLESLRVGSPWHLVVKFPDKESRRFSYPSVKELQLPDCLKDPYFVQQIPDRFPSLKKCWIFLPSVRVLRTFFRSMENSELEELHLKTQFDFEATMELCLLGRPSQAPRSYRDFMKHEDLEAYGKFEEFVTFYNIELPPKKAEDVQELEDPTCAGLAALKSLKILNLEHIPRVLRIPKGNLHWTHANAEFTGSFIGLKRYPLSRKCIEALPLQNLTSCTWPNFDVYVRDTLGLQSAGFIDVDHGSDQEIDSEAPGRSSSRRKTRGEKLKVQIHPAMLQANIKFRQKDEKP